MSFSTITFDCPSPFHNPADRTVVQSATLSGGKVPAVCYDCAHPEVTKDQHPRAWEALGEHAPTIFGEYAYQTGGWVMWLYIPDGKGNHFVVGDAMDEEHGLWIGLHSHDGEADFDETEPVTFPDTLTPAWVGIVLALHAAHVARQAADAEPLPRS
jgi:hypothetical protein